MRKSDLKDEDLTGSVSAKVTENKCAPSGIDRTYYRVCQRLYRKYKVFVFETVNSRELQRIKGLKKSAVRLGFIWPTMGFSYRSL